MPKTPHLVFAGSATVDMIFAVDSLPVGPGKVLPTALAQVAHGMATSAAVAAVRLGGKATLVTRIGNDMMGDRFVAEIEAEGVDCRHVRRFENVPTPVSAVIVDGQGERLVLPYYDKGLEPDANWIPDDLIQSADAVEVDVRWPEAAARVLTLARAAGKIAVLDADIGPVDVINRLAGMATHAVFSAPAAMLVSGTESAADATRALSRRFDNFVAVTDGPGGCLWMDGETLRRQVPPRVEAVDTLAAGDVFHGAFTLAIAEGKSIVEAIDFANAAAAIKCTKFGGRLGTPDRQTVMQRLAEIG